MTYRYFPDMMRTTCFDDKLGLFQLNSCNAKNCDFKEIKKFKLKVAKYEKIIKVRHDKCADDGKLNEQVSPPA